MQYTYIDKNKCNLKQIERIVMFTCVKKLYKSILQYSLYDNFIFTYFAAAHFDQSARYVIRDNRFCNDEVDDRKLNREGNIIAYPVQET